MLYKHEDLSLGAGDSGEKVGVVEHIAAPLDL